MRAAILAALLGISLQPQTASATNNLCNITLRASDLVEVASGVHVRVGTTAIASPDNGNALANISFVIGDVSVAVIDSGGSLCDGLALKAALRELTDKPVRYVINTHVHPDHLLGNAAFVSDAPEFIGHRRLPAALAARGAYYLDVNRRLVGAEKFGATAIVPPTSTVEDTRTIDLGGRELLLTAHGAGHTDNDLSVLDEKTGTLFTGDLVFMDHIPVIDGSIAGWQSRMAELETLTGVTRIVPGHGPASAPWPQAMEKQRVYLDRLAQGVRALLSKGGEIGDAKNAAAAEAQEWALPGSFHERNANAAFSELEWEE